MIFVSWGYKVPEQIEVNTLEVLQIKETYLNYSILNNRDHQ